MLKTSRGFPLDTHMFEQELGDGFMPVAQHNANPDKSDILMTLYLTWEEPEEPRTQSQ